MSAKMTIDADGCGRAFWSELEWLPCTDGKARPVEPGSFPLAHGVQRRTSKLRAYGNAIVPQVAAEFIKATYPEYDGQDDMTKSIAEGLRVIRERMAAGGPGWTRPSDD